MGLEVEVVMHNEELVLLNEENLLGLVFQVQVFVSRVQGSGFGDKS